MAEGLTQKQADIEMGKLDARRKETVKRMLGAMRSLQAIVEYAEGEIKKAQAQPASEKRDLVIHKNELRKQGALASIDTLQRISNLDLTKSVPAAVANLVEMNSLKAQYVTTEYYLISYRRIASMLEAALSGGAAPAAPVASTPAARTGNLPPRPGIPPAPGGLRPAAPVAPRSPMPPRPVGGGLPPRPGMPAAPTSRTGPLNAPRPVSGPLSGGTGPLRAGAQAAAATEQQDAALLQALRDLAEKPTEKPKIMMLLDRYRDLESTLQPLRGDGPGQLSISLQDAAPMIRQISGKVYYLNRAAAAVETLGDKLLFEQGEPDPRVTEMLAQVAAESEAAASGAPGGAAAAAAQAAAGQVSLSNRLKSLFKA